MPPQAHATCPSVLHTKTSPVPAVRVPHPVKSTIQAQQLDLRVLRKDGATQHRLHQDPDTVAEYADLMREGVEFPPIVVWYDGTAYWLTDGFQRVAAAELAGKKTIHAQVRNGTLSDARWDSYRANATHGVRRTAAELRNIVQSALQHPNASRLSNVQLATHLHIPEATLRRWRHELSSPVGGDAVRTATRAGRTYSINTSRIGKSRPTRWHPKSPRDLRRGLNDMIAAASPSTRRVLNILNRWAFGKANHNECLTALEAAIREWTNKLEL